MTASLEPGTIYAHLDDAVTAACCLCGLHKDGATVWGTTDTEHADTESGEAYIVATKAVQPRGTTWPDPPAPYEPVYTITKGRA